MFKCDLFNKKYLIKCQQGFTLIEILLVLAIIGVVASIAIPALIISTEKAEIAMRVIKGQSLLSQAVMNVKAEYGGILNSPLNSNADNTAGWDAIKKYFNLVKDCGTSTGLDCWPSGTYSYMNGTTWIDFNNDTTGGKGVLQDGSSIEYEAKTNCATNRSSTSSGPLYNSNCALVYIDVNGQKLPNTAGRDVFAWYIMADGTVYPRGALDDIAGTISTCSSGNSGLSCTAKVVIDKRINY